MDVTYHALEKKLRPIKQEARRMRGEEPQTPRKPGTTKRKASSIAFSAS